MLQLHLTYLAIGLLVLALGLYSKPLRRTFLSPPLAALLAGIAVGPAGLGILRPGEWGDSLELLEEAARRGEDAGVLAFWQHHAQAPFARRLEKALHQVHRCDSPRSFGGGRGDDK